MNSGFGRGCCSSDKKFAESCFIEGDSFKLNFLLFFLWILFALRIHHLVSALHQPWQSIQVWHRFGQLLNQRPSLCLLAMKSMSQLMRAFCALDSDSLSQRC